jgi:hypothetical protein
MKGMGGRCRRAALLRLRTVSFFIASEAQVSEAMHIFDGCFMASHFLL